MTIVLPHGVLFRGGEEGEIRKNLIEQNNIDAIIGLPANIFYGTGIPTIIMVLRQKRENTDILIVDASKGFEKVGKSNCLRACDIRKIVDTVTGRLDIEKYSRKISREEIRQNDYNLNIPRYVDSSEEAETWDLYASMFGGIPETELSCMQEYWRNFPTLKSELFDSDGNYANLKTSDIKKTIMENADVKTFISRYRNVFADFSRELEAKLIDQAETVSAAKEKDQITGDLFRRFSSIPLVDKYAAYELFSDGFTEISGDLELIQAEGIACVKQVDPNMVLKKKNGRDQEVQDGWKGHVLPFELVQKTLLQEEMKTIQEKENRLQEIPTEYTSLIDEMSEDDKEAASDALNDDNDAFVMKNVKRIVKELKQDGSEDALALASVLGKAEALSKEEKELKSGVKKETEVLHLKTKEVIESLNGDQVRTLLQKKWVQPICDGIDALPEERLSDFAKQIQALTEKYDDTLEDIENEIQETERNLANMLSELTGDEFDMAGIRQLQKMLGGEA